MEKGIIITVILPLKLDWEPYYHIPQSMIENGNEEILIGQRVKVLFSNKEYVGVISGKAVQPDTDLDRIKDILSIEKGIGCVLPSEIRLWRKVAEYYMCSVGEVYKAAYPIGKINLEEALALAREKSENRRQALIENICRRIEKLEERLAKKEDLIAGSKEGTKKREKAEEDADKIRTELSLVHKSLASTRSEKDKGTDFWKASEGDTDIELTEKQEVAIKRIKEGFEQNKPVLLHGVTGSGKTEIYTKLAIEALNSKKNVLYLVPEIALSRQLEYRLKTFFGANLMIFHSGESAAVKRNIADSIRKFCRTGENYIVLGTRSSLFLPHHDLGLIIVDEEHDNSYKQDSPAPRYNGRDSALILQQDENQNGGRCSIVLGSATPSLEELYNCQTGRHAYVRIDEKYHNASDADIEIIDTKAERRKRGMRGNFSLKLISHINRTLKNKEQVLILRSRRAWATSAQCSNCGEFEKCPHCNANLSYHKNKGSQICHQCGYTKAYTGRCIKCGGELINFGAGTQKIEEETAALFPNARVARMDSDTNQNKKLEKSIIKGFASGEIDILIGTQIITKGFDFSNLGLVAVIAADSLLGVEDFRADEKALQTLEQFKGRCGRREKKGLFVIQTAQPEHPVYQRIESHDSSDFFRELLSERQIFNFPPYSRIIEITIRDKSEKRCEYMSKLLHRHLGGKFSSVIGPYSPLVDKIENFYLRKIRINLSKDKFLKSNKATLRNLIHDFEKNNKYTGYISINVDPS